MSPCHFLLNPVLYDIHTVHSSTYSHSYWMYYVRDHNITDTVLFTSQCKLRHCCTSLWHSHNLKTLFPVYTTLTPKSSFTESLDVHFLNLKFLVFSSILLYLCTGNMPDWIPWGPIQNWLSFVTSSVTWGLLSVLIHI